MCPSCSVLKHPRNLGYGGNQKAGYRYFIEKGFDIVVLLHGDGQYAPEILAQLYSPLVAGEADAVFGSRMMRTYGGPLKGGMPLYKYVGNRILTILENRALGMNLTEFHSGYRAYNLHALAQLDFSRMTNDFHFDTEIIVKLHHQAMTDPRGSDPDLLRDRTVQRGRPEVCERRGALRVALPAHLPQRDARAGVRRVLRPLPHQALQVFQPLLCAATGGAGIRTCWMSAAAKASSRRS